MPNAIFDAEKFSDFNLSKICFDRILIHAVALNDSHIFQNFVAF